MFQDFRIVGDGEGGGKKLGYRDFRKSRLKDTGGSIWAPNGQYNGMHLQKRTKECTQRTRHTVVEVNGHRTPHNTALRTALRDAVLAVLAVYRFPTSGYGHTGVQVITKTRNPEI